MTEQSPFLREGVFLDDTKRQGTTHQQMVETDTIQGSQR